MNTYLLTVYATRGHAPTAYNLGRRADVSDGIEEARRVLRTFHGGRAEGWEYQGGGEFVSESLDRAILSVQVK